MPSTCKVNLIMTGQLYAVKKAEWETTWERGYASDLGSNSANLGSGIRHHTWSA